MQIKKNFEKIRNQSKNNLQSFTWRRLRKKKKVSVASINEMKKTKCVEICYYIIFSS